MLSTVQSPLDVCTERENVISAIEALEKEALNHVIMRLVVRDGVEEKKARALRLEYLRFMALQFFTKERLSPSPLVDQFWHAHILFTKDYHRFCDIHFGHYIHHEPQDHSVTKTVRDGTPGMHTKKLIEELFPTHDRKVWAETAICSNSHCDTGGGGDGEGE